MSKLFIPSHPKMQANKLLGLNATSVRQYQVLALFIILLSFFIALNSVSIIVEERKDSVFESVEQSFIRSLSTRNKLPSMADTKNKKDNEGQSPENIEAIFKSAFNAENVKINDSQGSIIVEVLMESFRDTIDSSEYSFESIMTYLRQTRTGWSFQLFLHYENDMEVQKRLAAYISQYLPQKFPGLKSYRIGLLKGPHTKIKIIFKEIRP